MNQLVLLANFFKAVEADPRVNSRHISLYISLFLCWNSRGAEGDLEIFSWEIMSVCKISASSTYHKTIRELHEYGYIFYKPSFNHNKRSKIKLTQIVNEVKEV